MLYNGYTGMGSPLILSLIVCIVLMPFTLFAEEEELVVASVNGEEITSGMMMAELVRLHSMTAEGMKRSDFSIEKLLNRLINDRMLIQEARASGLDTEPSIVAETNAFWDKLAVRSMLAELFPDTFTVTDSEIRNRFQKDFERFEYRMLSVTDSILARQLLDSLQSGTEMAALVARHSVDRFRENEGLGASYTYAETPSLVQKDIPESEVGTLIGPVDFGRTFSIIRIENRIAPDITALDSLSKSIGTAIRYEKRVAARDAFILELRKTIDYSVDTDLVEAMAGRIIR